MFRLALSLLVLTGLTACGEVVLFGHTVREGNSTQEQPVPAEPPSPQPSKPAAPQAAEPAPQPSQPAIPQAAEPAAAQQRAEPLTQSAKAAPTSSVERSPAATHDIGDAGHPTAVDVRLILTARAKEAAAADSNFHEDELLKALNAELRARRLLGETNHAADRTLEISIEEFSNRPTSNAVLFGYNMSAGTLAGTATMRDMQGKELRRFQVQARSRLVVAADAEAGSGLEPLYRRFARLTADNLTGAP
jgi:hypothetical protein